VEDPAARHRQDDRVAGMPAQAHAERRGDSLLQRLGADPVGDHPGAAGAAQGFGLGPLARQHQDRGRAGDVVGPQPEADVDRRQLLRSALEQDEIEPLARHDVEKIGKGAGRERPHAGPGEKVRLPGFDPGSDRLAPEDRLDGHLRGFPAPWCGCFRRKRSTTTRGPRRRSNRRLV